MTNRRSFPRSVLVILGLFAACEQRVVIGDLRPGDVDGGDRVDAGVDAGADAGVDGGVDGGVDAGVDAGGLPGCFDGTREGLGRADIAACRGTWDGWIDESAAASLCAAGWHVCRGTDPQVRTVTFAEATAFSGCFAFDAAQDCYLCFSTCRGALGTITGACTVPFVATDPDMAGMGAGCRQQGETPNSSCLATGRLDSTTNTTGCQFDPSRTTGVVCCRD